MKQVGDITGTILIYTMILVILWVFMATVILNVAAELSSEYEIRNIEVSLINVIQTKSDLAMKYARTTNTNGSGFIDNVGCPSGFTMSGATQITTGINTDLKNELGVWFCEWTHAGNLVKLYFNSGATDLDYAQYEWREVSVNSGTTSATFLDSDSTFIDLAASFPLESDLIDDNFDSDDYRVYSTGTTLYPDIYADDDVDSRLKKYGYIIEGSWPYNVFWSNDAMIWYIEANTYNDDTYNTILTGISSWYLYFDVAADHRMRLFEIDKNNYNATNEIIVTNQTQGQIQTAGIGYLQNDMTLSSWTGSAYNFDFTIHDYAIFIENASTGALLYQITGQDAVTGSGIYLNPLKDDDASLFSYLGSHMIIGNRGELIGTQLELFGLK